MDEFSNSVAESNRTDPYNEVRGDRATAIPPVTSRQSLSIEVPSPEEPPQHSHTTSNEAGGTQKPLSPLYPSGIVTRMPSMIVPRMEPLGQTVQDRREKSGAQGALLIHPRKIDDFRRFRMLFVGLMLFIVSSTQAMHSIFGLTVLQMTYYYSVKQMASVFICGSAFGLFVFPFGWLYDCIGPRPVVGLCTVITALGHLLFALMFHGKIEQSVARSCIFYGLMSWGCYGLDVVTLPAVLTHMPRDRGQPTGLLKTFSGLGAGFFTCLFRGFFNGNYYALMYFLFALTVVFGAVGTWYLEDAPYVVDRVHHRRMDARKWLRVNLIRNRYMSQMMPKPRFFIVGGILLVLNFYMTIQVIATAYLQDQMTPGKYRGVAIGSIIIVLSLTVLIVPLRCLDGTASTEDTAVVQAALAKEAELRRMQQERHTQQQQQSGDNIAGNVVEDDSGAALPPNYHAPSPPLQAMGMAIPGAAAPPRKRDMSVSSVVVLPSGARQEVSPVHHFSHPAPPPLDSRGLTEEMNLATTPRQRRTSLSTGQMRDMSPTHWVVVPTPAANSPRMSCSSVDDEGYERRPLVEVHLHDPSAPYPSVSRTMDDMEIEGHLSTQRSFAVNVGEAEQRMNMMSEEQKNNNDEHPRVETITVSGEVFVTPVYKTTFFQSLRNLDIWLMFWTTMVMWGVGLSMTTSWCIYMMSMARYAKMQYKEYVVFAAMSAVSTAGGRVFLGLYETFLTIIRRQCRYLVVPTAGYPLASIGFFITMIIWISLPGTVALVTVYIIGPAFYGLSTSMTMYVIGTIFERDLGMHYGFCFTGASIGMVFFFYLSWFLLYNDHATPIPYAPVPTKWCIGERRCMNRTVGIYIAATFTSIISSLWLHLRYRRLVLGPLRPWLNAKGDLTERRNDPTNVTDDSGTSTEAEERS